MSRIDPAAAAPPDPALDIRGLTRRFGDLVAVDGLDLRVPRGSFFGFLGPNGAGKTTTLRMLTGLLEPTAGEAWIDGLSVQRQPVEVKRRIGVVPDDLALFDRLTLREHVVLGGRVHGLDAAETARRAEDLLATLDLWNDRDAYAGNASHGMRRKLALAMALLHRPSVLLLDEPFEGVDPIAGKTIRDLLAWLVGRGVTIFLTSHILEIVERLADRVAILVHGRLAFESTLAEVRASGRSLEDVFVQAAGGPADALARLEWLA
jgi:ABC-2 type transport system ATP-binding protein